MIEMIVNSTNDDMKCLTASTTIETLTNNELLAWNYNRIVVSISVSGGDIINKLDSFKGLRLKLCLTTGDSSLLQAWWFSDDSTSMHRFISSKCSSGCSSQRIYVGSLSRLPITPITISRIARTRGLRRLWVIIGIIVIIIEDICFGFITNITYIII